MADVFRVFLQFARAEERRSFQTVELAFRGQSRFALSGQYFSKLGEEYGVQNPVYTMRTFTENLSKPDGSRAYPSWTGGLIGVAAKQMDQFNDFQRQWWVRDSLMSTPQNSMTTAVLNAPAAPAEPSSTDIPTGDTLPSGPLELPGWLKPYPHQEEARPSATADHVSLSYEVTADVDHVVGHYEDVLHGAAGAGVTYTEKGNGTSVSFTILISRSGKFCNLVITKSANTRVDVECFNAPLSAAASAITRKARQINPRTETPTSSSGNKDWSVVSVESRITESNNTWSRFAWKLVLRNDTAQQHLFRGTIEFQDRDGFIVDTNDAYNLVVPANAEQVFTGFALINSSVVEHVARTVAKVTRVR
jgi:hypothetical protein